MIKFQKLNTILGWAVFSIALLIYLLTLAPSVSFWDCGEFIATSYKLQIGHPPGAPFYNLMARVVSIFAPDKQLVAKFINAFSAIASAATILFLYWSIVRLVNRFSISKPMVGVFSGLIGALTFAFTDTFWFSAVEAEVYALSMLFTAVIFWAILKWEAKTNEPYADRWIVLIAYLVGLSIGVHLLNLLVLPAIALVWYFKNYKASIKMVILTILVSVLGVLFFMFGLVQGSTSMVKLLELLLVNEFSLPYNSGFFLFIFLLLVLFVILLRYTRKNKKVLFNLAINCLLFVCIGYSSYAMVLIRSNGNPSIDQNNPENAYSLGNYLNRSQYGSTPFIYGQYYNAPIRSLYSASPIYLAREGKYIKKEGSFEYNFDRRFKTFFPRMYSTTGSHVSAYKEWSGGATKPIEVDGKTKMKPTFGANLRYFVNYQVGFMYLRYFMWNFSGRQNDLQGYGGPKEGNWITGIKPIDEMRLGFDGKLPETLASSKTYNPYFMLPLLLGCFGLLVHLKKHKQDFLVVLLLFLMAGFAIVVYLNQTPYQPRERDYAYVGSFYAFSIWIGIGAGAIYRFASRFKNKLLKIVVLLPIVSIPVLVLAVNFNDHDRSDNFIARDFAENYLNSCEPDAILFTYGDNDTFPLWYIQDVEGVREDVRICNTTLMNLDWYLDQLKQTIYHASSVPFSMKKENYEANNRNSCFIKNEIEGNIELSNLMKFILSDDRDTKIATRSGRNYDYLPGRNVKISIDKNYLVEQNLFQKHADELVDSLVFRIKGNYLSKSDLAILDVLNTNNWERPIYFDLSVIQTSSLELNNFLRQEGFAYRLVPYKQEEKGIGFIDTEILFNRVINQFGWGNLHRDDLFLSNNLKHNIRNLKIKPMLNRLSAKLIGEGKKQEAEAVLNKLLEIFPIESLTEANDYYTVQNLYALHNFELADQAAQKMFENSKTNVLFYRLMPKYHQRKIERELSLMKRVKKLVENNERNDLSEKLNIDLMALKTEHTTKK